MSYKKNAAELLREEYFWHGKINWWLQNPVKFFNLTNPTHWLASQISLQSFEQRWPHVSIFLHDSLQSSLVGTTEQGPENWWPHSEMVLETIFLQ